MLEGIESGNTVLVVGSGGSIREHKQPLLRFIEKTEPIILGVNGMTHLCKPRYHLWTNRKQYGELGCCIDPKSRLIVASSIPEKLVRQHYKGDYIVIEQRKGNKIIVSDTRIHGDYRTAGAVAIVVAHCMGAASILVAGMDGYTLYPREEIEAGKANQHCYGEGKTDDASWEECLKKDLAVQHNLDAIVEYGIAFKIITPTKFACYYDPSMLRE